MSNFDDNNRDLEWDPGILNEFYHCSIGNGKAKGSSSWDRQQSKNTQARGPQIERI